MKVYLFKHNKESKSIFINEKEKHFHYAPPEAKKTASIKIGYIEVDDKYFEKESDIHKALFCNEYKIIQELIEENQKLKEQLNIKN